MELWITAKASFLIKKKIEAPVKALEAIFNLMMLKTPNYKYPELKNSILFTALGKIDNRKTMITFSSADFSTPSESRI